MLAATAMPVEVILRLARGEISERGVRPVTTLACTDALLGDVNRRGVIVTRGTARTRGSRESHVATPPAKQRP